MICTNCKTMNSKNHNFCYNCGEKIELPPKKLTTTLYLHGEDESFYSIGEELGLTGEALIMFSGALYEVEFEVEVDTNTGIINILSVDGCKLVK